MDDPGEVGPVGHGGHHRTERLLIVRPQEDADGEAAGAELEDLPGVVRVAHDMITGSFDIVFDPGVVSDDELAAALELQGYELIGWQEVRAMRAAQQRTWLLEQIGSLAPRAGYELGDRGSYAAGLTKGSVDAYIRVARAFGLVTDTEILELLPPRFLEEGTGPRPD